MKICHEWRTMNKTPRESYRKALDQAIGSKVDEWKMNDKTKNAVIVTCSSLEMYVDAAQKSQNTEFDVVVIDRLFHVDPEKMKAGIRREIEKLSPDIDTILVAMGFCGGVWDHVSFSRRVVIPRVDDCVSMLLQTDDCYCPNRKETGHMYLYEQNPADFSAFSLMRDYSEMDTEFAGLDREMLFHMWFDNYHFLDIIDTGMNDCYSEEYVMAAQENADQIGAALDYVPGSNRILEKLVSGRWDEQFLVAEAGHLIRHGDFF